MGKCLPLFALILAISACSLADPPRARVSLIPGITKTKYHLRQNGPGGGGSDFFPWDIGSLGSEPSQRVRAELDLEHLLPIPAQLYLDLSKVDASQDVTLDPARPWNWNGDTITSFASQVSFEREELGFLADQSLTRWLHLRYGVALRRFHFDGDIITDVGAEQFNFDTIWLSPEIGLEAALPWGLEARIGYGGFRKGEMSAGDNLRHPERITAALRRDFGRWGMTLGYELDAVEQERPLDGSGEFAHIRLRTVFWAFEFDF